MADKWPLANGNWSSAANWNDGTKPVAGDDVYADGKTVTIDEDVTVGSIRTTQRTGGTAGGGFTVGGGRVVTANVGGFISGSSTCITTSGSGSTTLNGSVNGSATTASIQNGTVYHSSGINLTINGNVTGGSQSNSRGVYIGGQINIIGNIVGGAAAGADAVYLIAGTLNVVGNITGGSVGQNTRGVQCYAGSGTVNVTGNIYAGNGFYTPGLYSDSNNYIWNITGNVYGGSGAGLSWGIGTYYTATINITGNIFSGSALPGIGDLRAATLTVNGNIESINSGINAAQLTYNTTATINGNCTGTSGTALTAANSVIVTVNGSCVGGNGGYGLSSSTSAQVTVSKAVGNAYGTGSVGISAYSGVYHSGAASIKCKYLQFGSRGMCPVIGPVLMDIQTDSSIETRTSPSQSVFTFTNPANTAGLLPSVTDVRSGVNYNVGNLTGTCAVPAPINVTSGVLVDNTVGTAILTEQTIRSAMGLSAANLDTKFNNLSTQIGTLLSNSPTEAF